MTKPQPDILLLYSDQHAPIAGCYGDAIVKTPNLDKLANSGTLFTNCYCPSPICLPSRMSFLTAREPHRQSAWTNRDILPSGIPTFAHSLGAAGYDTVLAGRMHSIGPDQMRGYSRRLVGDHSANWLGGVAHDLGPLAKANDPWRDSLTASGPGRSAYETYDHAVTEAAIDQLEEIGRRRADGDSRPFALTIGWILPHAPYVCSPELFEAYKGKVPPPSIAPPEDEHPHYEWWRKDRGVADATPTETMRARTAYYGLVETLDTMIGRVLSALKQAGLSDNTLVIYTSDHGEHLGNRGLWWKSTLYDEAAKVPLIMSLPGVIPANQSCESIVNLTDVTATMLDIAGAKELPNSQGQSFAGVFENPAMPWSDETFCEYVNDGVPPWAGGREVIQRMVRLGRYKYIYHHGHRDQLFDLQDDPPELRDLIDDPAFAGVGQRLLDRVLAGWDPNAISASLATNGADQAMLEEWAKATRPTDLLRWEMKAEDNWLTPLSYDLNS
uniref:sulfatase-like hydrolase/transferase n=1 Tax=Pararhizobium sp. IMCC3301 TaxID=3067904 RepID=UPI0027415865|nr:sulfatase-like hydrolase/transferase [Pararhizobium sp. IMCC3301]